MIPCARLLLIVSNNQISAKKFKWKKSSAFSSSFKISTFVPRGWLLCSLENTDQYERATTSTVIL